VNVSVQYLCEKLDKLCKRRFCHKHYGVQISASSNIFETVNKACSAGSSLDKIHNRLKAVLTEEKLDKAGTRFEHSPHKISNTTKTLCLPAYKIRQDKAVEEHNYRTRTHFCNWFL
jgi:hypothetical protein